MPDPDKLLSYRVGLDGPKPAIDLESPSIVQDLISLFLGMPSGHQVRPGYDTNVYADKSDRISLSLRQKVLTSLCKSVTVANCLDASLVVQSSSLLSLALRHLMRGTLQACASVFCQGAMPYTILATLNHSMHIKVEHNRLAVLFMN